ncbi:uncharacterized protein TNCV_380111 [Trichonephila clavipes]|nr:uncharacterized protein TNCV_380111 [Trichonephila clavipes]
MPKPNPFVPASERHQVFNALHRLSHPGSRATACLISTRFVWPRVQSLFDVPYQLVLVEALPVVLLGICSVFKEDLQSSSTELVYGEPLCLPGEFSSPLPAEMQSISTSDFVDSLRTHISRLHPVPASYHAHGTPFVFKDLETCTNAMLQDDSIRGSLQPPYSGPYHILQRIGKVLCFHTNVDRIKPAYVLADDPPSSGPSLPTPGSAKPTVTTCSSLNSIFLPRRLCGTIAII